MFHGVLRIARGTLDLFIGERHRSDSLPQPGIAPPARFPAGPLGLPGRHFQFPLADSRGLDNGELAQFGRERGHDRNRVDPGGEGVAGQR